LKSRKQIKPSLSSLHSATVRAVSRAKAIVKIVGKLGAQSIALTLMLEFKASSWETPALLKQTGSKQTQMLLINKSASVNHNPTCCCAWSYHLNVVLAERHNRQTQQTYNSGTTRSQYRTVWKE